MESYLHLCCGRAKAVFHRSTKNARVEEGRLEAGEATLHVIPDGSQLHIGVSGRVTVDSSPAVRAALLQLLRRAAAPVVVIDFSAVSYLDTSGLATLLEVLKAARERLVKLRVIGIRGEARNLAEVAQLDTIFRVWGSEVEFQ